MYDLIWMIIKGSSKSGVTVIFSNMLSRRFSTNAVCEECTTGQQ